MAVKNEVRFKKGDLLVVDRPTNFHKVGEIALVVDTDWFGVVLEGKAGHFHCDSFRKATSEEIFEKLKYWRDGTKLIEKQRKEAIEQAKGPILAYAPIGMPLEQALGYIGGKIDAWQHALEMMGQPEVL